MQLFVPLQSDFFLHSNFVYHFSFQPAQTLSTHLHWYKNNIKINLEYF